MQQRPVVLQRRIHPIINEKAAFVRTPIDGVIIKVYLYLVLEYLISDIKLCLEIYAESLVESLHLKLLPI